MGRCCCLAVVLIIALLPLFFYEGSGRKVMSLKKESLLLQQENPEKGREMIQVTDYSDPKANTNPRTGDLIDPPSPAPP